MNQDQQSMMDDFFKHPDAAINSNDTAPLQFHGFGLNDRGGDMNALGFQMPNGMDFATMSFNNSFHMPMPSVPRSAHHMSMPHLSQNDVSGGFDNFVHDYDRSSNLNNQQPITHADEAATTLLSMSSRGQEHSQPATANELNASSWGNLNMGNPTGYASEQLHSPAVSAGPSSGSTKTPMTPNFPQQYMGLAQAPQAQYQQQKLMPPTSNAGNFQHTRHGSMNLGNPSNPMPGHQLQPWSMQQCAVGQDFSQRRPSFPQYGSDQNFGQQGYQNTGYSVPEDKSDNLLNVPFANHAAGVSRAPTAAGQQGRSTRGGSHQQRHSVPSNLYQLSNAALAYQDSKAVASPTQTLSAGQFKSPHTIEGTPNFATSRKRRRSQIEGEVDASQGQSQVAGGGGRHTPITFKTEPTEHDDAFATPPASSNKRRKSIAHLDRGSRTASASPTTPAESTTVKASSSKKRRGEPKPPRLNLSDIQKRNNHIASEQKRRDAMKTNYEELHQFVPSLATGGHGLSRSEILQHTADHLQLLVQSNKSLMHIYGWTLDDLSDDEGSDDDAASFGGDD